MIPPTTFCSFILPSSFRPIRHINNALHPRPLRQKPSPKFVAQINSPRADRLLLVGLGNPGPSFSNTRHNIGFEMVDEFVRRNGKIPFKHEKRFQADVATLSLPTATLHVVKPRTYMNNSGLAVRAIMSFYKLTPRELLVVADDMSLPVGRIRLRAKGSAGGHNGLKSIEKHLATREYPRLKVGVSAPHGGSRDWKDFVIAPFSRGEQDQLIDVTWDCMEVLESWLIEENLSKVINKAAIQKSQSK